MVHCFVNSVIVWKSSYVYRLYVPRETSRNLGGALFEGDAFVGNMCG